MEKKNGFNKKQDHESLYVFCLYVTGASPNSSRAISNIKGLCEDHLKNRYELSIIDVYQQPKIAQTVDIIALPLLIRKNPLPERRLIGDMSDKEKVIRSLDILNSEE
ncbi:MAG TPA: circadian clock KaiB family protein [Chitinophagaceae bacterium]|jgi:circadian clock protein KaiB